MPWCEQCGQGVDAEDVAEDGTCPVCGEETVEHRKMPFHFRLMIWATVVYLGYRAFQGITWLVHHV